MLSDVSSRWLELVVMVSALGIRLLLHWHWHRHRCWSWIVVRHHREVAHEMIMWNLMELRFTEFGVRAHRQHVWVFLCLHPSILEPDFYLPLSQFQSMRDFNSLSSGQVTIAMEFFFQFKSLCSSVSLT